MERKADFFRDEVRNGFYIPAVIKQAWAETLSVLDEIDRICAKHHIRYFADWGTFLGAVRHGGFVPWDDDLDICMLRDDYEKFRSIADAELPEGYVIHDYERKEDHWLFLARVVNSGKMCFTKQYLSARINEIKRRYRISLPGKYRERDVAVALYRLAEKQMAVAANAVRRFAGMPVAKDRPVAVCGLGPIGLMVVMFLKEAGYKDVFVIGNKDAHRERADSLGVPAERYYDSCAGNAAELIRKDTDGGVAAYFECVGKNESIVYGMEITSPGGQVILVGNPYSDMIISRDAYWQILRKQLTVSGIWNSSFLQEALPDGSPDDWHYVLQRLTNGEIDLKTLISHRLGLEGLEQGIVMMRDKTGDYCKVMMVMK